MAFFKRVQTTGQTKQNYQNAEDVFRKETRDEYKKKCPNLEAAKEAQKAAWLAFSDDQKEQYINLYLSLKEQENDLAKSNGGSKKEGAAQQEGNIPPKPKHGLNGYLTYLGEQREGYTKQHPFKSPQEITKGLSEIYNTLSDEQKNHYKQKAKKQAEVQDKLIEKWEEQQFLKTLRQYGEQIKEEKKKQKELRKYNSDGKGKGLSYQEILSKKEKRKLVQLGNDVTKQEGKERGRPKKSEYADSGENSKSQQINTKDDCLFYLIILPILFFIGYYFYRKSYLNGNLSQKEKANSQDDYYKKINK